MAGTSQGLFVSVLISGLVAVSSAATAQIPLPTPAPQAKERPQAKDRGVVPPPPAAAQPAPHRSFPNPLSGLKSLFNLDRQTDISAFDAKQRAQVDRVSQYLSSVQQLTGNFVQVGPDGGRVRGTFYIQKPGKVRFEYDPPTPIDIIADGQSVVVRDRKLATQDLYPLSQTPLRFLLADRIDLLRDTNVIGVNADDVFVSVVIEERQPLVGTSRLMMMVGAKDYQLKQWTVTDPQGYDTTVAVSNLDTKSRPDPSMFMINYERNIQ
jgi:outer membrane lipoprotein-sorting protein